MAKVVPDSVATSPRFRRVAFRADYTAIGISVAQPIVGRLLGPWPLLTLIAINWLLMIFMIAAWSSIPPDRAGTDLKLRRLTLWVVGSFIVCGNAAFFLKPFL